MELSEWLDPNYDPDRDFIPPFDEEEVQRMTMRRPSMNRMEMDSNKPSVPDADTQRIRNSF